MSKSNTRLGKGLNALIGPRRTKPTPNPVEPKPAPQAVAPDVTAIKSLSIDAVIPNRHQPRSEFDDARIAELAASIKTNGVFQPIVVRPGSDGKYELIAGERRWRAARLAKHATVPAIVREATDAEALELALVENLQRQDLNAIERAVAYQRYTEAFGASPEQLAARLGESRANVVNYMRLLSLAADVRAMIERGELGMGQARAIAGVADKQRQLAIAKLAVRRNLSVRQVEALVKPGGTTEAASVAPESMVDANLAQVQKSLSKSIGVPVTLHAGKRKNSGRIVIRYANLEEFDRIAERLSGNASLE